MRNPFTTKQPQQKSLGLTSEQAAALILSDGRTTDVKEAEYYDQGKEFDMDGLLRSGLRRRMGFDFKIKVAPNKIHVYSDEGPRVSAHAKIKEGEMDHHGNIVSEDLINRLVNACITLKDRHDAALEKTA